MKQHKRYWAICFVFIFVLFSGNDFSYAKGREIPPAPTLSFTPMTPTNGDVTVTAYFPSTAVIKQYRLGDSGIWTSYTGPVVITSNVHFYIRYQDKTKTWSTLGGYKITNIDKTPPTAPAFTPSTVELTSQPITLTIHYSSDSMIQQYKIGDSTQWIDYNDSVILSTNNTVYAKASDSVGNWSSSDFSVTNIVMEPEIPIDVTPPTPPIIEASSSKLSDNPVTLTINYSSDSTIRQYKIGTGGYWTEYNAPVTITNNSTIYAKSSDEAGNSSEETAYTVNNIRKTILGYTYASSSTSVSQHISALDEICTATFNMDGFGNLTGTAPTDQLSLAANNGIRRKLMVSNNFNSAIARELLESPVNRENLKRNILNLLSAHAYSGVDIDIENIPAANRDLFTSLVSEIYSLLKPLGYEISVAVQAKTYDSPSATWNYAFDYQSLAAVSDHLLIMTYDEHYSGGTPGPIASIDWVTQVVNYALAVVPKEKIVLGLAAYGYDWGGTTTKAYSVNGCYNLASQYGATVNFDNVSKSKYFNYTVNGQDHTVWFEDGDTIAYKLDLVNAKDLRGIGIWRLGLENEGFWSTILAKLQPVD